MDDFALNIRHRWTAIMKSMDVIKRLSKDMVVRENESVINMLQSIRSVSSVISAELSCQQSRSTTSSRWLREERMKEVT